MSLDQDALATGRNPNGMMMGYQDPGQGHSRHDLAYEPELEGSSYQTALITSLAIARWTWAVVGLLVGALLGFLSATGGGYKSTSVVQLTNDGGDTTVLKSTAQTIQQMAGSDDVLQLAVRSLRANAAYRAAGGSLPNPGKNGDDSEAKNQLGSVSQALWVDSSTLVNISVIEPDAEAAIYEARAIADAVKTKIASDADSQIRVLQSEASALTASQTLGPAAGPLQSARVGQIGQDLGTREAALAFGYKQSVTVIEGRQAVAAGPNQNISALLGAAGGAFLGALGAVAAGAGRRKPHSPRELMSLAPDLVVRTTVQAGELAGRVLETDRRSVVVLAMPDTRFAATQLAMAIAHHLRTHGATVAVVDRVSEFSPSSASEDRLWALRRDVRRNIPANFSADMLVVVCGADEEALSLIAGQSDLLVAVVAKQRKTILADIRRTVDAVRISEPGVVLAR
jgi:hypothetical protein